MYGIQKGNIPWKRSTLGNSEISNLIIRPIWVLMIWKLRLGT